MQKEILNLICCPNCQSDLKLKKIDKNSKEKFDKLVCKNCNKEFIIKDDIPILLNERI